MHKKPKDPVYIPFLKLRIHDEFEARLLREVLQLVKPPRANSNEGLQLRSALQKHFAVHGFAQIHKAPESLILASVRPFWLAPGEFAPLVLSLWKSLHCAFVEQVSSWLTHERPESRDLYRHKHAEESFELDETLTEWAFQAAPLHPGTPTDAVKLAMAISLYELERPGLFDAGLEAAQSTSRMGNQQETSMKRKDQTIWKRMLSTIRSAAPEEIRAEDFERFLATARLLVDQKIQEQASYLEQERLRQQLQSITGALQAWESYFDFKDYHGWSLETVPLQARGALPGRFDTLVAKLNEFRQLRETQPASRSERPAHDRALSEAEEQVIASYSELNRLFGFGSEPKPIPEPPPAEEVVAQQPSAVDPVSATKAPPVKEPETVQESMPEAPANAAPASSSSPEPERVQEQPAPPVPVEAPEPPLEEIAHDEPEDQEKPQPLEPTLPEVGLEPMEPVTEEDANDCLLEQLRRGEYAGAYWIAAALEDQHLTAAVPSWLIAAARGNLWLLSSWPEQPRELLTAIRELVPPDRSLAPEQSILALAIGVGLGMAETSGTWDSFLQAGLPEGAEALRELVTQIDEFRRAGLQLDPRIIQSILEQEELENRTKALARRAVEWLALAPDKRTRFRGADQTWKQIVGSRGSLAEWYGLVAEDRRNRLSHIQEQIEKWSDRRMIVDRIQEEYHALHGKGRNIEGEARDQMVRWLQDAVEIAQAWCQTAQEPRPEGETKWLQEKIGLLRDFLRHNLPRSIEEARQLQAEAGTPPEQAGCAVLVDMLQMLGSNLGLASLVQDQSDRDPPTYDPARSLEENLAVALTFYPGLPLKDNDLPERPLGARELAILTHSELTVVRAFDGWLSLHDYRFLEALLERMNGDQDAAHRKIEKQLDADLNTMASKIDQTRVRIEQALADGLVAEEEYIAYNSRVESIRKQLSRVQISDPATHTFNLRALYDSLETIQVTLKTRHAERIGSFRKHWDSLMSRLHQFVEDAETREQIIDVVNRSFEQQDLRAVTETMAHLDDVAAGNRQLSLELFSKPNEEYKIRAFSREIKTLIPVLDHVPLQQKGEEFTKGLPSDRGREVKDALNAWQKLKSPESRNQREANFPHLIMILKYLGWEIDELTNPVSIASQPATNFQHWRVAALPRIPSPIPQFGSERVKEPATVGRYDVVGAWGRPGFEAIEAYVEKLGRNPCIILYFARLQPMQRAELLKLSRKKQLPLLVVDELLMLYLAKEYGVRLSTMFACTLPYATVNPYVPFAAGGVPPEMYFGRDQESKLLIDPRGPAIGFGGRQLGKSALLRKVQREFHKPDEGRFAIYEDIRLIGDPTQDKDYRQAILERLLNAFIHEGIIEKPRAVTDLDRLSDLLITQIRSKGWRILLLIDEADSFLEADAQKNFYAVTQLKRVMDQTDRSFKVVFAGLHHVQQFKNIANQPLAHLGDTSAIEVGPLEPNAAIELIRKPLRELGYVFGQAGQEDPSLIAHILSYTNYHSGLLQLFGHYLVEHLNAKPYSGIPPFAISRADIEAVYRNLKVRETISDRFNITLRLDERYEAITLALILEQMDEKNGFDRLFTPEELYEIAKAQWPQGFGEDVYPDKFKVFLDEMRGLGVLSASGNENRKYRLRSPNLVSLMGTEDQIISRLETIAETHPASKQRIIESYHAPINPPYYSPLTYSQETEIRGARSGVCLVFGSEATRIYSLEDALKAIAQKHGGWNEIRTPAKSGAALVDQLKKAVKEKDKLSFLMAFRELEGTPEEMLEQVSMAAQFCRSLREHRLRVIFRLDALSAAKWFRLPAEQREMVEQDYVDFTLTLNRWNKLGIRQLLEQHEPELLASDGNIKKIYEVTGGWPYLLDRFIELCNTDPDPLPAVKALKELLQERKEVRRFFSALGLVDERSQAFLERLLEEDEHGLKAFTSEEVLSILFEGQDLQEVEALAEYLKRLSLIRTLPYLQVEPVVGRLLNERER